MEVNELRWPNSSLRNGQIAYTSPVFVLTHPSTERHQKGEIVNRKLVTLASCAGASSGILWTAIVQGLTPPVHHAAQQPIIGIETPPRRLPIKRYNIW